MNAIRPATAITLADEYAPDTGNPISILHGNGFFNVDPDPHIMINADQSILID